MRPLLLAAVIPIAAGVAVADDMPPAPRVEEAAPDSPRDSVSFMKLQGALKQLASAQP